MALRLAGLWILWAAWCQCCGWWLSALHQLSGWGYLTAAPILLGAGWWWLKTTAAPETKAVFSPVNKLGRRFRRPLPMIYLGIAALSLVAALLYAPWSFDATSSRLPRILYWWAAQHWYWIGTIDHRLDLGGCGYEWQMLPVIIFTRTDRLIFLLSWIPFLLLPGLVFYAFRALGVTGRSARRWMWLLPSGFCYALQCSGLQNDGYMVLYTLGFVSFAVLASHRRRAVFLWLALLAAALLTSAKLSNLPLLLPLGLLLLPALRVVNWMNWRTLLIVFIAVGCSFVPLAFLCWKHSGDWSGDPTDRQWGVHPRNSAGAFVANSLAIVNDTLQPPVFPVAKKLNNWLEPLNQTHFMQWLRWAQPNSEGFRFGEMVYEGQAGLGCGLGLYGLFLLSGVWFVRSALRGVPAVLPWAWRLAPWTAWLSLGVLLAKLAFTHVTRYGAPYYPLCLISILLLPRIAILERRKVAAVISGLAMLAVVPVILLTPARPVIPCERLAQFFNRPALQAFAAKYHFWAVMRDDLAPLRDQLPPGVARVGYAGGFRDTSYGLWKPFGSRVIVELGLPLGSKLRPPVDLEYAVVTERGLRERYGMGLAEWLGFARAQIIFEMKRNTSLVASDLNSYEVWYLVRFRP